MSYTGKGQKLGKFRIIDILGDGGMSTVFLAQSDDDCKKVALKLLTASAESDKTMTERFRREFKVLGQLNHPNLVRIFEAGQAQGHLFYTMEYIRGKTLNELITDKGALSIKRSVSITRDLADALKVVHDADVIHRDIKPANVIIARGTRPVLMDFGLAKIRWMDNLTRKQMFVGTYQYAAPETLAGLDPDERSDIYQLGLLCYVMLTGRLLPFGRHLEEIYRKKLIERLEAPSTIRTDISRELDKVLFKAMARDPENRFCNAAQFRDALSSSIERKTRVPVKKATSPDSHRSVRTAACSRPTYLSTAAVHLVVILSLCSLLFSIFFRATHNRRPEIFLPVAMAWIQSEWDALSFGLGPPGTSLSSKELQRLVRRQKWCDRLLDNLNRNIPSFLDHGEPGFKRWLDFAFRSGTSLKLEKACKRKGLAYKSPARETIHTLLLYMARRLSGMKKEQALATLKKWRAYLAAVPLEEVRTDSVLRLLGLPSTAELLLTAEARLRNDRNSLDEAGTPGWEIAGSPRESREGNFLNSLYRCLSKVKN